MSKSAHGHLIKQLQLKKKLNFTLKYVRKCRNSTLLTKICKQSVEILAKKKKSGLLQQTSKMTEWKEKRLWDSFWWKISTVSLSNTYMHTNVRKIVFGFHHIKGFVCVVEKTNCTNKDSFGRKRRFSSLPSGQTNTHVAQCGWVVTAQILTKMFMKHNLLHRNFNCWLQKNKNFSVSQ